MLIHITNNVLCDKGIVAPATDFLFSVFFFDGHRKMIRLKAHIVTEIKKK